MIYIRIAVMGEGELLSLPQSSILKISSKKTEKARKETALGEAVRLALFSLAKADGELVSYGEHGKPYLLGRRDIAYNISHSENIALGVLLTDADGYEVGCDVELIDRKADVERQNRIAKRFFTENEREAIASASDGTAEFYRIWSLKEAYIKYTGEGLSRPLQSFDVTGEIDEVVFTTDIIRDAEGFEYAFSVCIPKEKYDLPFDTEIIK